MFNDEGDYKVISERYIVEPSDITKVSKSDKIYFVDKANPDELGSGYFVKIIPKNGKPANSSTKNDFFTIFFDNLKLF